LVFGGTRLMSVHADPAIEAKCPQCHPKPKPPCDHRAKIETTIFNYPFRKWICASCHIELQYSALPMDGYVVGTTG